MNMVVPHSDNDTAGISIVSIPVPEVSLLIFTRLLQGDGELLNTLGLTEVDLYPLRTLPSELLPRLLSQATRGEIVEVRLHRQALQRFLNHLQNDSRSVNEIRMMILAEASHPFMQHFYGMPYAVYHHHRQQTGLVRSSGRPVTPVDSVANEIGSLLKKLNLLSRPNHVGPFDLLAIHQLTGYSLRDVWWVYTRMTQGSRNIISSQ